MRKGDVWLINLDPTIGAEIKKTRPAVIVSERHAFSLKLYALIPSLAYVLVFMSFVASRLLRRGPSG
jgi:PemK-like, MazF-like toxin of type II toxin-antitoxin system